MYLLKYFTYDNHLIIGNANTPNQIITDLKTIKGLKNRLNQQLMKPCFHHIYRYEIYQFTDIYDSTTYRYVESLERV